MIFFGPPHFGLKETLQGPFTSNKTEGWGKFFVSVVSVVPIAPGVIFLLKRIKKLW